MTAKPVPEHISDERVAEIIKGCEGVTPGPWGEGDKWVFASPRSGNPSHALEHIFRNEEAQANAAHVARLDPQTVAALLTELQHRREAEAEPAFWHNGQRQMITNAVKVGKPVDEEDARWISRFDQPLYAASPSSPASGVRVKALEWAQNWHSDPLTGFATVDHINRTYTVDHDEPRFYASTNVSPSDYSGDAIGNYGSFDEAKAACQADYEARIRSALEIGVDHHG